MFRNASKHFGADFIAIMKRPYVVGKLACVMSKFLM